MDRKEANELIKFLVKNFGIKNKPESGIIGIHRKLDDGINEEEALFLLKNDINSSTIELHELIGDSFFSFSEARRHALILLKIDGFKFDGDFISALTLGFWEMAAKKVADSGWFKKAGKKAWHVAERLRTGAESSWIDRQKGGMAG